MSRASQQELEQLDRDVAEMGRAAETQLVEALRAVAERDVERGRRIVEQDLALDDLERKVSESAVRLLALRQPVAVDLREAVAAIRISGYLERAGDLAKNLGRRAIVLERFAGVGRPERLTPIGQMVAAQLRDAVESYVQRDAPLARAVWGQDELVDDVYEGLFREFLTYMMEDPRTISVHTHLLFMAKNIERIGDLCTSIAQAAYYLVTGASLDMPRPKGADARVAVVEPRADAPSDAPSDAPADVDAAGRGA